MADNWELVARHHLDQRCTGGAAAVGPSNRIAGLGIVVPMGEVDVEDVLKAIQDAKFTNEVYIFSHTAKSGYWPRRTSELLTEYGVSEKEHW